MPTDSWKLAPGLNNVGSYQVSGQPFTSGSCKAPISGSTYVLRFPQVTKWVKIEPRLGGNRSLRVGFSANGLAGKHGAYFHIHQSSSMRELDLKVSELHFVSEDAAAIIFDVVAGMTSIPAGRTSTATSASMNGLTRIKGVVEAGGPSWSGSIGVS
jgi:hypothetical protein